MGTKINRKLMKIFGQSAGVNQRAVFGSLAAGTPVFSTDPETIQSNGNYLGGWFSAVLGGNSPAIQDMNSLNYLFAYQLAYLMQSGVAEWDTNTEYFTGSLVMSAGRIYSSLVDNNLGYAITDTAKWAPKNPMTAAGDLVFGGVGGKETRLPIGAEGQVLTATSGNPVWGQGVPPGTIFEYGGLTVPTGYLALGQDVLRALYPNLFSAIGVAYGIGNGLTTFTLPPAGYFTRQAGDASDPDSASRGPNVGGTQTIAGGSTTSGNPNVTVLSTANLSPGMTAAGAGIPAGAVVRAILGATTFTLGDAANTTNVNATSTTSAQTFSFSKSATGNYLGSVQASQFASHNHTQDAHAHNYLTKYGAPYSATGGSFLEGTTSSVTDYQQPYIYPAGGNETRPVNISIKKIIKY